MKTIVISLGGSIVASDGLNTDFMGKLAKSLEKMDRKIKFGIVVGGGSVARSYISALRKYGVNDNILDEIGINATRMNALALASFFEDANSRIPTTVNDAVEMSKIYRFTIMGGTEPGHTTDTVSALLAERINSGILINATSVDGVYTSDPRKEKKAKKIDALGYDESLALSMKGLSGAGSNVFMDPTALNIAKRSKIKIFVINGLDIGEYKNVIEKGETTGSVIR
ncbi:MAG: UMP kinase [Nitrososphaerota archaeon]|jgi:uridylate kinase|nr:UMP kinase [Candidatus Thermoplasmatota archaeon]MDG7045276.1 UMP kinase [Nitrososphaerota archaeon]